MKPQPPDPATPVILLVFYKDSLMPRRKEWAPLSTAAAESGFLAVVAAWENLKIQDGMVKAAEAFSCKPGSASPEVDMNVVFKPDVVMTTWGTSGYHELFERIVSLGARHTEVPLIAQLDGKCDLELCLRDYERTTGNPVSRPRTWVSDELVQDGLQAEDDNCVILKPSRSGKCRGIEMVRRSSLKALALEAAGGKRPPFVVQDLVEDVFPYHRRRWDIRLNVLATSLDPLRYHLYPQGVAKTTGAEVKAGSIALDEWLNADSFLEGQQEAENLLLTEMLDHIAGEYMPLEGFWERINEVVGRVFSAIAQQAAKENQPLGRSFMYPGFDFIVERDGAAGYAVRLLEINSHPGLGWGSHITAGLMPQFRTWFEELVKLARSSRQTMARAVDAAPAALPSH